MRVIQLQYTRLPAECLGFRFLRSANRDSLLKRRDLYGRQQLRRRFRAPLPAIIRFEALRLKACVL